MAHRRTPREPFLLTAGFFETHRPYPPDRYEPADRTPSWCPIIYPKPTMSARTSPTSTARSPSPTPPSGQLLDTLAATGLDRTTWVVFMTDHGPALPRAKSTLYDAGTGIAMIVRPPARQWAGAAGLRRFVQRCRPAAHAAGAARSRRARRYRRHVACRQPCVTAATPDKPVRSEVYTTKTYHDSFDPIRAVRTKEYTYIENYAGRPLLDLPWDVADSAPGKAVAPFIGEPRPERELYDLVEDPTESHNLLGPDATDKAEAIADDLALLLHDWRLKTNDVIPSEFAGTRISERYTETYLRIHGPYGDQPFGRSPPTAASKKTTVRVHRCLPLHTWYSHRNAAAARCSSSRFGPPAWQVNRASSSSTCPPRASRRSHDSGSKASRTTSILRLLDPLDEGKPDLAPPEIWRDYIRTVGRTPNGIWGGKLMWNQTPLLLQRAAGLPDRSGDGLLSAIRDVDRHRSRPHPRLPS